MSGNRGTGVTSKPQVARSSSDGSSARGGEGVSPCRSSTCSSSSAQEGNGASGGSSRGIRRSRACSRVIPSDASRRSNSGAPVIGSSPSSCSHRPTSRSASACGGAGAELGRPSSGKSDRSTTDRMKARSVTQIFRGVDDLVELVEKRRHARPGELHHALVLQRDLEGGVRNLVDVRAEHVPPHRLDQQRHGQSEPLQIFTDEQVGVAHQVGQRPVRDHPAGHRAAGISQPEAVQRLDDLLFDERIQVVGVPVLPLLALDDGAAIAVGQLGPRKHREAGRHQILVPPGRLTQQDAAVVDAAHERPRHRLDESAGREHALHDVARRPATLQRRADGPAVDRAQRCQVLVQQTCGDPAPPIGLLHDQRHQKRGRWQPAPRQDEPGGLAVAVGGGSDEARRLTQAEVAEQPGARRVGHVRIGRRREQVERFEDEAHGATAGYQ